MNDEGWRYTNGPTDGGGELARLREENARLREANGMLGLTVSEQQARAIHYQEVAERERVLRRDSEADLMDKGKEISELGREVSRLRSALEQAREALTRRPTAILTALDIIDAALEGGGE